MFSTASNMAFVTMELQNIFNGKIYSVYNPFRATIKFTLEAEPFKINYEISESVNNPVEMYDIVYKKLIDGWCKIILK